MTQRSQLSSLQMTELWFSEGRNEHEVIVSVSLRKGEPARVFAVIALADQIPPNE